MLEMVLWFLFKNKILNMAAYTGLYLLFGIMPIPGAARSILRRFLLFGFI